MVPSRLRLSFFDSLVNAAMVPHEKSWFETKPDTATIRDLAVSIFEASPRGENGHASIIPLHPI